MRPTASRWLRLLTALLVASTLLASTDARADEEKKVKPKTKRVHALSEWAFKRINAAHDAIAAGKYDEAASTLDEIKGSRRLNDHEQALVWQSYGYIYGTQGKYQEAIEAFENCMAKEALPDAAQRNVEFNVAQLYVMLGRHDDAVRVFQSWFAKTDDPSPQAHHVYAIALFQTGDKQQALEHVQAAMAKTKIPKEAWLQIALAVHVENKQYKEALDVLESLAALYPKKYYWVQLSALYAANDDYQQALSALVLAYQQGMLTEERELRQLAQLYLYNRIPHQAALVIEKGMADGHIPKTADTWRFVADAWVAAREREKAEKPLEEAAAQATDGELYLRLAHVQIEREQWTAARKSLTRALEKGHLADPGNAHLLLGIASVSDANWAEARKAFRAAAGYEKTAAAAKQWLREVDAETGAAEVSDAAGPAPSPDVASADGQ